MSDTENILQTIKSTVQDIVAPDVRELKVRMSSLEVHMGSLEGRMGNLESRLVTFEEQMNMRFEAFQRQSDAQFRALMAAIQQSRAEAELSTHRQLASLSERVAALETHRQ